MTELGDCYEAAGNYIVNNSGDELRLCHGTVTGTGGGVEGVEYGHAWVELHEAIVIDVANGKHAAVPLPIYYAAGNVKDVHRYTRAEAVEQMLDTEHYGPWQSERQESTT